MAVRNTLERWFVGEPVGDQAPSDETQHLMRTTALELARVGEVADVLRTHLQAQEHERNEVLRILSSLPEPLGALPRIAAQQDRLGETIAEALVHVRQRDASVDATLGRIVDGIAQQTEVSGLIQQQLDLNLQAANGVAEGSARLSEAVAELTSSNRQGTELLVRIVEQTREITANREQSQRSLQAWTLAVLCMSAGLMVAAVILGWLALTTPR